MSGSGLGSFSNPWFGGLNSARDFIHARQDGMDAWHKSMSYQFLGDLGSSALQRMGEDMEILSFSGSDVKQAHSVWKKTGSLTTFTSDIVNASQGQFFSDGSVFFKNETQAYNYMWKNSNYGKGSKMEMEHFGFITKGGVIVLPTHGLKITLEPFQNNATTAEWFDVYNRRGKGSAFEIFFQGTWVHPIASIHTHPASGYGANEWPSYNDRNSFRNMGIPGFVLGPSNLYGMSNSGVRNNAFEIYSAQDLLKGKTLIIPNIGTYNK